MTFRPISWPHRRVSTGDEAAGQLAPGLKPERLQAWEKALRFEPVEEPAESEEKAEEAEEREAAEKKSEEEEAEDKPALEDILYPGCSCTNRRKRAAASTAAGQIWPRNTEAPTRSAPATMPGISP